MKVLYHSLWLCLFTLTLCWGQSSPVFKITKLPKQGILLDKGWKWHAGDNPEWAQPEFDDSTWEAIDPTKDIMELPQVRKAGKGYFRMRLWVDSSIKDQLAMMIQQSGASEIYLNGKLIHRLGIISTDPQQIKAFDPNNKPVFFPISKATPHVLAIRYSLQPNLLYTAIFGRQNRGFKATIHTNEGSIDQYYQLNNFEIGAFRLGAFFILSILNLAFYLFYRVQKANLYFTGYAFLLTAAWVITSSLGHTSQLELQYPALNLALCLSVVAGSFLLLAIYTVLEQQKNWAFWSLIILGIISIPCGAFIYGWGWLIYGILYLNLINLNITYIAFKSVRNNKKGAWIIASGCIGFLVFWVLFSLQWSGYLGDIYIDSFTIAQFSIPIAVSVYLGYDFALTHRSLQQQLGEVEKLSLEKQQLLTTQNETLEREVTQRTVELQSSLKELKATQAQLIQKEKLASLGELTAGIAHEIQNPLNFVNNFSEVSTELVQELNEEIDKDSVDKPYIKSITADLTQNLEKITHHGKRADNIVKGMLEHSRTSTGQKEPTDLNKLADEYLRLAYHGLRAKVQNFSADLRLSLDPNLGPVNLIQQDMGRVLMNLYNNALYAVLQKQNENSNGYRPQVEVSTLVNNGNVELRVKDNGVGIPKQLLNKIYQPFFTTKPTGEGTGLGLSLTYDIVTKGHGGELSVQTEEGQYTEFVVRLPATTV